MRAASQGSDCQTITEESASSAGAEKHVESEFRFEERAEGLAGAQQPEARREESSTQLSRWRGGRYDGRIGF